MLAHRTAAPACSPSSWPRLHHDEADSGDVRGDATAPGTPTRVRLDGRTLRFTTSGDDLLCGRPAAYEISAGGPFTRAGTEPVAGGQTAEIQLQGRPGEVSVRAVDDEGNLGRTVTARR